MCVYEKLMSSVSKGIKNALTEEQEIISSNGILSASEKEDLIYDQTEEYLSYHKEESINDNVLSFDLENTQTVFVIHQFISGLRKLDINPWEARNFNILDTNLKIKLYVNLIIKPYSGKSL